VWCSYPVFNLFNCSVRAIKLMQNRSGDNESSWNTTRYISVSI
jgi:hypothetical protein